jgi:tetratricopeptide (TPR) repeat protein
VPASVDALERWADRQLEREYYGRALNILGESLRIRDTAGTRRRIARIHAISRVPEYRNSDTAREHARRAFELAPDDHAGILELVEIYRGIEDYEDASAMCEAALKIVSGWQDAAQKNKETKRLRDVQNQIEKLRNPSGRKPEARAA